MNIQFETVNDINRKAVQGLKVARVRKDILSLLQSVLRKPVNFLAGGRLPYMMEKS